MTLHELANLLVMPVAEAQIELAARFKDYMMDNCGIDVEAVRRGIQAFLNDVNKK